MNMPLRHSHIAILDSVPNLAAQVGAHVLNGEDDLGPFRYFDLTLADSSVFRFASHDGDRYVHLLASMPHQTTDLVRALTKVGVNQASKLSISTDQNDKPLLDRDEISQQIANLAQASASKRWQKAR